MNVQDLHVSAAFPRHGGEAPQGKINNYRTRDLFAGKRRRDFGTCYICVNSAVPMRNIVDGYDDFTASRQNKTM